MKFAMADGRAFTTYAANCSLNEYLQKKYNVSDAHAYRRYLQTNAEKIMSELKDCYKQGDCEVCPHCNQTVAKK